MEGRLKGRVAVITGGARGIGKATARKMLGEGASVAILDMAEAVSRTAEELQAAGGKVLGLRVDVTRKDEVFKSIDEVLTRFGRADILVNNAGLVRPALLEDVQEKDWDDVVNVNLKGTFFATRAVLPSMKKNRFGKIV
ncbi:MAG TPA: SDR family NAD(P)-dependent oxidoreductase, partial [Thermodesulfobacteriota bacterium]|nr:SDR family NAD(P)-dependent oxidoreductase [Thermodesulfobacteriota bacterium]